MNRRAMLLLLLLLIGGAIVNVAVAWGLPTFTKGWHASAATLNLRAIGRGVERYAMVYPGEPEPASDRAGSLARMDGRGQRDINTERGRWFALQLEEGTSGHSRTMRTGWPLLSLHGPLAHPHISDGLPRTLRALQAMRPLWPGFLVNTLFYALLLWLIFFAPFAVRRALRRRRGACEKCAYPIGTSPVCTECGTAVVRKAEP